MSAAAKSRGWRLALILSIPCALAGKPAPSNASARADALTAQLSSYLVVDQFGYLPDSVKTAVVRSPVQGFDAAAAFAPGASLQVIDASSGKPVFSGAPTPWQGGKVDAVSGDRAWWFDFTALQTPGRYFVFDKAHTLRSPAFTIGPHVYREVLVQAVRTFYYQRAGLAKTAALAGRGWADAASHLGPLQDSHCRRYDAPGDASTERDLQGGWYDAGDYNKYTAWTAAYVVGLLKAYTAAPAAFSDATNIPESGNGVPDILDEARWGLSWLARMQNGDGSVLSIVGLASASPPSAATGPSLYGPASTSATLATAAAFAYAATVYKARGDRPSTAYAKVLRDRAERAYDWGDRHPRVLFKNNDAGSGSLGLGSGQQETDDHGRLIFKLAGACYLFELTGSERYQSYFAQHYTDVQLAAGSSNAFDEDSQELLQHCAALPGLAPATRQKLQQQIETVLPTDPGLTAQRTESDPYQAGLSQYTWGSNAIKAAQGLIFLEAASVAKPAAVRPLQQAALGYLHYLHGVNPLGLVYLSNMQAYGATTSVKAFFHTWFSAGSSTWSRVGTSTFGPPPGFLTGGPNPSYHPDACCPNRCRGMPKGVRCDLVALTPPLGQPPAKSYKDFNQGWPVNSWEVTENSNSYQVRYIRLLSRFVQ